METKMVDKNLLEIIKIKTNPEYRGQGVAEDLSRFVFEYAREKKYKILPTC